MCGGVGVWSVRGEGGWEGVGVEGGEMGGVHGEGRADGGTINALASWEE